jgi:transposase InsO family protein
VLPYHADCDTQVGTGLTDNGRKLCGTERHVCELYSALNDIDYRRTKVRSPKTNGFGERFHRAVLEEFFPITLRKRFYGALEGLQPARDAGLIHYNRECSHPAYRNRDERPSDTVNACRSAVRTKAEYYALRIKLRDTMWPMSSP